MKKVILAFLFVMFMAVSASAQTHACDVPAVTGTVVTASGFLPINICAPAVDQPDGVVIEVSGSTPLVVPVQPVGTPNAAGKVAIPATVVVTGRGTYTVRVRYYNVTSTGIRQESPLGSPFVLVYEKVAPTAVPTVHLR